MSKNDKRETPTAAPPKPPSIKNLDDDNQLIAYGRAFYQALVECDSTPSVLEKLGRSIFAKTPWPQLDASSRLVMVRTMILFRAPKADVTAETPTPEKTGEKTGE